MTTGTWVTNETKTPRDVQALWILCCISEIKSLLNWSNNECLCNYNIITTSRLKKWDHASGLCIERHNDVWQHTCPAVCLSSCLCLHWFFWHLGFFSQILKAMMKLGFPFESGSSSYSCHFRVFFIAIFTFGLCIKNLNPYLDFCQNLNNIYLNWLHVYSVCLSGEDLSHKSSSHH